MTNGNEPAYPFIQKDGDEVLATWSGLTKRELIAAMSDGIGILEYTVKDIVEITGIESPDQGASTRQWDDWRVKCEAFYKVKKADALISALTAIDDLTDKMKGE